MPCPRLRHAARYLLPLGLVCQWACLSNTIELETMAGSGSAGSTGDGTTAADDDSNVSVTITVTTTVATTVPTDESGSVGDTETKLDFGGVDPGPTETLLLAADTVVSPGLPFQGIVWLERGGAGTVNLELQWLSLDQGSTTEPRALVGDVYSYAGIPVAADGSFSWDAGVLLIPGAANPITGSDITASIQAEVVPLGSPYCGRIAGEVMSPIVVSLEGSTHAMTTVESVDALPLEFPVACP